MSEVTCHYLSFRVGAQWYGVRVDDVIEVLHFVALTELPSAPPDVLGLLTLRNMVMPVIDLRRRFGLADAPLSLRTPIIAVRAPHGETGLVVDEADDVERIAESQMADYQGIESPYVGGVARLEGGKLLLLLDPALLKGDPVMA